MSQWTQVPANPTQPLSEETPTAAEQEQQEKMSQKLLPYEALTQQQDNFHAGASEQQPPTTGQPMFVYVLQPGASGMPGIPGIPVQGVVARNPQQWAMGACDAVWNQPYCALAYCCTPCLVYLQRKTLLHDRLDQYVCCAGICGNANPSDCPTSCCPGGCGLFMESLCCTPCAISGNRAMLASHHQLTDTDCDTACQYTMYGSLCVAFAAGCAAGVVSGAVAGGTAAAIPPAQLKLLLSIGNGLSLCSNVMAASAPMLLSQHDNEMKVRNYGGRQPAMQVMQ